MGATNRRSVLGGAAGAAAIAAVPFGTGSASAAGAGEAGALRAVRLTTEHVRNPLGIDVAAPRFGWRLRAAGTDRGQSAYRITVGSRPHAADVWDSGKVTGTGSGDRQTAIGYAGPALAARTRYHWRVQVWDERGRPGAPSQPAWFETALLSTQDWTARWIGTGMTVPNPVRTLPPTRLTDAALKPGRTLGQSFRSASEIVAVTVLLSVADGARVTMTLRQGDASGRVLASAALSGLTPDRYGNTQGRLDLPRTAPAGRYYLELAEPRRAVSWPSAADVYPDGTGYADGEPVDGDRWVYCVPPNPPANPVLRREFTVPEAVASARLYIVGLGYADAWINGQRVGDEVLTPALTDYDVRTLYRSYDVTSLLRRGGNAIGVALGRGFFATRAPDTDGSNLARWIAEPRLKAQLEITTTDGARIVLGTDRNWRLTEGPTTYDGALAGESYDARRAARLRDWTEPGFAATGWRRASIVDGPGGTLRSWVGEPVRTGRTRNPVAVTSPVPGVRVYDFGVNLAGWARLRGRIPAGRTVSLRYAEKLGADGRITVGTPGGNDNASVDGGRLQLDEYTGDGSRGQRWAPSFTYKGFRYVEVIGAPADAEITAVIVGSDLTDTMDIRLGEPVLQWIADAFHQTARNCLHGHPSVSPYLKTGWTSGTYRAAQPMLYQFGMASVFGKWLDDIRLGQAEDGTLPLIAPPAQLPGMPTPSSTGVYPYLLRRYWLHYGDLAILRKHFEPVRRYVGWLLANMRGGMIDDQFGDWYPPRPEQGPWAPEGAKLVGTAYAIESIKDAAAIAEALGETGQAHNWRAEATRRTEQFNRTFLDTTKGVYRTDVSTEYRQTSSAVPLAFGMVPRRHITAVAANLADDVRARERHLNTGALGTVALPYALTDHGSQELAHAVLTQRSYPSYGYLRGLGASTFWESWEAGSRGHNDTTLSGPVGWLVERVLGVAVTEPGWARFRVAPSAFGDLPGASLTLDTPRGTVAVSWRRAGRTLTLDIAVPVNAVAELRLPNGTGRELGSGRHRIRTVV